MNEVQSYLLIAAPFIAYLLGGALRVIWPYLLRKAQDGSAFDWNYAKGQILVWALGLVPMVLSTNILTEIGGLGWLTAFGAGFGAGSIGRESQKTVGQLRGE